MLKFGIIEVNKGLESRHGSRLARKRGLGVWKPRDYGWNSGLEGWKRPKLTTALLGIVLPGHGPLVPQVSSGTEIRIPRDQMGSIAVGNIDSIQEPETGEGRVPDNDASPHFLDSEEGGVRVRDIRQYQISLEMGTEPDLVEILDRPIVR